MKLNSCVNYEALHDRICIIHNRYDFLFESSTFKIVYALDHKEKRDKNYGKFEVMRILTMVLKHLYLMQENGHTLKGKNPCLMFNLVFYQSNTIEFIMYSFARTQ